MTQKVKLPADVARALDILCEKWTTIWEVLNAVNGAAVFSETEMVVKQWTQKEGSMSVLMAAIVNGYEAELSPEEKLQESFANHKTRMANGWLYSEERALSDGITIGIKQTLNILGIKIEGINA